VFIAEKAQSRLPRVTPGLVGEPLVAPIDGLAPRAVPICAIKTDATSRDALDRLTRFGWGGGVTMALLLSLASFLIVGYFTIY